MKMNPRREFELLMTRRQLFGRTASGIGVGALASLLGQEAFAANGAGPGKAGLHGILPATHFPAKAKRVIYLFQSGAPSHLDLFDWKPQLEAKRGIELPESVRIGQRLTGMTSGQATKPVAPTIFKFAQHGQG